MIRRALQIVGYAGPMLGFAVAAAYQFDRAFEADPADLAPPDGGLVVVCVFDQVRADTLERYAPLFGPGGFERVKRDGVWYAATLPHAGTATGPGHAGIATGVAPDAHGVIDNEWYDRAAGAKVVAAATPDGRGSGPGRLLAPSVADAVIAAGGKVVSVGQKARAAVLLGGREPTACYWFDTFGKEMTTAPAYRDIPHGWVRAFHADRPAEKWGGRPWDRLRPAAEYDRLAGPDAGPGEAETLGRTTFPYPVPAATAANYGPAVEATPAGNEFVWEFARAAIKGEQLGTRAGATDLLYLAFAATDVIGHAHGPDSHEAADALARADGILAELIDHLDATVGDGRWSLVVTSDHGVCPLPESAAGRAAGGARFHPGEVTDGLPKVLDAAFGVPDAGPGKWVERVEWPWVYLNQKLAAAEGVPPGTLETAAAEWLKHRPKHVETAFTRTQLAGPPLPNPVARRVQRAFHPARSGDVYVLAAPYALPLGGLSRGTTHGTPHDYDVAVPVLALGRHVPRLGRRTGPTDALVVAPLTAKLAGVDPPAGAVELPPELAVEGPSEENCAR